LALRPNDLIIWRAIEDAKRRGFEQLDFGLSDWNQEGLARYKRKYASEEGAISFLRYDPKVVPSEQSRDVNRMLTALTSLLTDDAVADEVTERAGELLYVHFA
jgi:hypothetical protein